MTQRLATAFVGIPLLFAAVWIGPPWFSALVFIAALAAAYELSRLANLWGDKFHWGFPVVLSALFISAVHGWTRTGDTPLFGNYYHFMAIPAFALMTMRLVLSRNEERPYPAFGVVLAASVYVGGLLSYAILLRSVDQGREWMLLLLLVVFATDTAAFFGGRAFGKTPLAPTISPSKTREGAVAGMFGAVVASVLAANLLGIHAIMVETILLGVLVGALAQLGDLVESRLKRKAGVKDSGALVPGHGGILDRLDSIVFTLPAVYYFVIWEVQQKGLLS